MTISVEALIAICAVVLGVIGTLTTFAVKMILHRMDRMEADQGMRFDFIERQISEQKAEAKAEIKGVRERLHQIAPLEKSIETLVTFIRERDRR